MELARWILLYVRQIKRRKYDEFYVNARQIVRQILGKLRQKLINYLLEKLCEAHEKIMSN